MPVNASLIAMLQAISRAVPPVAPPPFLAVNMDPHSRWVYTQSTFNAIFYTRGSVKRGFTAKIDGQLEAYGTNAIEALVECKAKS